MFTTLAMSTAARLEFLGAANVSSLSIEIQSMLVGGMIAAFRTPIDDVALERFCSCDDERRRGLARIATTLDRVDYLTLPTWPTSMRPARQAANRA